MSYSISARALTTVSSKEGGFTGCLDFDGDQLGVLEDASVAAAGGGEYAGAVGDGVCVGRVGAVADFVGLVGVGLGEEIAVVEADAAVDDVGSDVLLSGGNSVVEVWLEVVKLAVIAGGGGYGPGCAEPGEVVGGA